MDKTAIKNFSIWARRKLISEIIYKANLIGINEKEILSPTPASTVDLQLFDIGSTTPSQIVNKEIVQRNALIKEIKKKEAELSKEKSNSNNYEEAFIFVVEEIAYTWFNRLIAIRFMEVNDYLPSRVRVLSSETKGKIEPDIISQAFEVVEKENWEVDKEIIEKLKEENKLDELFRLLFIAQCNHLNKYLPELFEKTANYTELLLTLSFTDKDGVVSHLVNDIKAEDFEEAVEIIGWMYQFYITEKKEQVFANLKKNVKITKDNIPAATQLFTPDWIVRYMVENSLGRLFISDSGKWLLDSMSEEERIIKEKEIAKQFGWKYYLPEAEQTEEVRCLLIKNKVEASTNFDITNVKIIDPCMGSGHILVYAFDVLLQIYENLGYSSREIPNLILEHNIYGIDIDDRAGQLAYFALMMKARKNSRNFFLQNKVPQPKVYAMVESKELSKSANQWLDNLGQMLKKDGTSLNGQWSIDLEEKIKNDTNYLIEIFENGKEYGSLLKIDKDIDYPKLKHIIETTSQLGQISIENISFEGNKEKLIKIIEIAEMLTQKYDAVITNPPYMTPTSKQADFVKKHYPDSKTDLFAIFIEKSGELTKKNGYQAMITMHSWMFLSSYEKLRNKLIHKNTINMAHLGARAFEEIGGEVVQTTAFVLKNSNVKAYKATYKRLVDYKSQQAKEDAFLDENLTITHYSQNENFSKIPGMPVAYWVSEKFILNYDNAKFLFEVTEAMVSGNKTADNNKFLRFLWEVKSETIGVKYYLYAKGGEYRKCYGNIEYVVDWSDKAKDMYRNNSSACMVKEQYWFKKGLTYTDLTSKAFSCRVLEEKHLFDMAGPGLLIKSENLYYIMSLLNSVVASGYLSILSSTFHYKLNELNRVPILINEEQKIQIDKIAIQNIYLSKIDWDSFETSWDFTTHPLI